MAKTESYMLELGTLTPGFRLPDFKGEYFSLEDFKDAPALLENLAQGYYKPRKLPVSVEVVKAVGGAGIL